MASLSFESEEAWLAARKQLITASDSRAILGHGYADENALTVYADKVDPKVEIVDNPAFLIGHLLEEPMSQLFTAETGQKLRQDRSWRIRLSETWPWMGATLDRWYFDEGYTIPVEMKAVGLFQEWNDEEPPVRVQIQVQHQMACCGAPYAWVVGFGGVGRVWIHKMTRDERFIEGLILALLEFRAMVENRNPPDPDWSEATSRALFRLHPDDNGLGVDFPPEIVPYIEEMDAITQVLRKFEKRKKQLENAVKSMLGPNTFAALPGGGGFSWKTQARAAYEVQAGKSRVLRRLKKIPAGVEFVHSVPTLKYEVFNDRDESDSGEREEG